MTHEPLIRELASGAEVVRRPARPEVQGVVFVLWAALATILVLLLKDGGAGGASPTTMVALTGLTLGATAATSLSAIPGRRTVWAAAFAAAGMVMWALDVTITARADLWGPVPWTKCFRFTALCGAVLGIGWWPQLRRTWPVRPRLTAALALTASAAAAALATTLECPSIAPLHVAIGHILPVLLLAGSGAIAGLRLFAFTRSTH